MAEKKGFATNRNRPQRKFLLELKYRSLNDGLEVHLGYQELLVAKLQSSALEQGIALKRCQELLYCEQFENMHVNQIFVLTADGGETLMRVEKNQFYDESCQKLDHPQIIYALQNKIFRSSVFHVASKVGLPLCGAAIDTSSCTWEIAKEKTAPTCRICLKRMRWSK